MHNRRRPQIRGVGARYNTARMRDDMAMRGWMVIDLARRAKVAHTTVYRFLNGESQSVRMAKKLAKAMGHPVDRYLIPAHVPEAVSA